MSAKSMRRALGDAPRLLAVTAAVVAVWTFAAAPGTAAAVEPRAIDSAPEADAAEADAAVTEGGTDANLTVEVQLTINDGPLIDPRDIADAQAGDALAYTYRVTNTGATAVSSPAIKAVTFTGSDELGAMFCPGLPRTLAPEMSFACGRTYVVSDDDVSTGDLVHTVVASGIVASGTPAGGDTSEAITVTSSQASVAAQVASGARGSAWVYLFPVAALIAVLFAVAWSIRDGIKNRRRAARRRLQVGRAQPTVADDLAHRWAKMRPRLAELVSSESPAMAGDDATQEHEEGKSPALGDGAPRVR